MGDLGFPAQHTQVNTSTRCDKEVLRSRDGMIKIAQILFGVIGFICIQITSFSTFYAGNFFTIVSLFGICFTGILLVSYLFHVVEKLYYINWKISELVYCGIMAVLYLACSCLAATSGISSFAASAFCGFCAMVFYAFDSFSKFKAIQVGEVAQGEWQISKTTSPSAPSPGWNVA